MSEPEAQVRVPPGSLEEDRIDSRRYLAAVRRSRRLITAIVLLITGTVVALSLTLPKTYDATARIVLNQTGSVLGAPDAESTQRTLATLQTLLQSNQVQEKAAEEVGGETAESLAANLDSSVDTDANVINVVATDRSADRAAEIANATADAFLKVQGGLQRRQLSRARRSLEDQINRLRNTGGSGTEIVALERRISDLGVQEASAGSELQLAEPATPPQDPARPRPVRNGILAFFAAIFIGVLIALGRDQLSPRINDARELGRLLGLRVLSGVPYVRRGIGRRRRTARAIEHEAYQTLAAILQLSLPAKRRKPVVLVTSAVHAEGKTTVTAHLGRALARAGHRVLLVSGDLRWPTLHDEFGLSQTPGLTDAIRLAERAGVSDHLLPATIQSAPIAKNSGRAPKVDILTSGSKANDPGQLIASDLMLDVFDEIRDMDFDYCLIDAPPVLGIADVPRLSQETDALLVVGRLDRLKMENAIAMREALDGLDVDPVGLVVIGAPVDVSPYYLSERALLRRERQLSEDRD